MRLLRATTLVILGLLLAACSRDEGARLGKGAVVVRGLSTVVPALLQMLQSPRPRIAALGCWYVTNVTCHEQSHCL